VATSMESGTSMLNHVDDSLLGLIHCLTKGDFLPNWAVYSKLLLTTVKIIFMHVST